MKNLTEQQLINAGEITGTQRKSKELKAQLRASRSAQLRRAKAAQKRAQA